MEAHHTRRTYDHRIREAIFGSGDRDLFANFEIPYGAIPQPTITRPSVVAIQNTTKLLSTVAGSVSAGPVDQLLGEAQVVEIAVLNDPY